MGQTWQILGSSILAGAIGAGPLQAQLVDFESIPGDTVEVGLPVSTQYLAEYGIEFAIAGGSHSMFLGDYGGERQGWRCMDGAIDCVTEEEEDVGNFFLAHPDAGTPNFREFLIRYANPTEALGFDLLDIDAREEWTVAAFDPTGVEVGSVVIGFDDPNAGDGVATHVAIENLGPVSELRVSFTGTGGPNIGFGFDNFSPFCAGQSTALGFETFPGGQPQVGQPVSTEYSEKFGVSFRVDGEGSEPLYLGDYEGERQGWRCDDGGIDCLTEPDEFGEFFLAHPGSGTPSLGDVLIDYRTPTRALEFRLADIDAHEEWEISCYDTTGAVLDFMVVGSGDPGTGDGLMTRISVEGVGEVAEIRIHFSGTGSPNVGFGFDDFYTACSTVPCQLQAQLSGQPDSIERDQTLEFYARAANQCAETLGLDEAKLEIAGPAELEQTLYRGPLLEIASGVEVGAPVRLRVPPRAPLGTYTIAVSIWREGELLDRTSFELEVL